MPRKQWRDSVPVGVGVDAAQSTGDLPRALFEALTMNADAADDLQADVNGERQAARDRERAKRLFGI